MGETDSPLSPEGKPEIVKYYYTNIDNTIPLRGSLLDAYTTELRIRSEEPLSPESEGKLKYEVSDRLFFHTVYDELQAIGREAGLTLGKLREITDAHGASPQVRPIKYKLYQAQEEDDEFTANLIKGIQAAGMAFELSSADQVFSMGRALRTEKMYDELVALQTGQQDIIKARLTDWQKDELQHFQQDIEEEREAFGKGEPTIRYNGHDYYHMTGTHMADMAERYLIMAQMFFERERQSPLDYVKEIELESAEQTFINAVLAYSPVSEDILKQTCQKILENISVENSLPLPDSWKTSKEKTEQEN